MKKFAAALLLLSLAAPAQAAMTIPPLPAVYGRMHLTTSQSGLSNNVVAVVALDTIDADSASICNASTHVCTVAVAGKYLITCRVQISVAGNAIAGDNLAIATIQRSGTGFAGMVNYAQTTIAATSIVEAEATDVGNYTVGQTIGCGAKTNINSFSAATILGGGDTAMKFNYLGP